MERTPLHYNQAFLEISGDPQPVLALLPNTVSTIPVTADTPAACSIPDLSPGFRKNLAHLRLADQPVIVTGCQPAVSFLLSLFARAATSDRSPAPTATPLAVFLLTVPCAAPYQRKGTCYQPRPAESRRGDELDLFA